MNYYPKLTKQHLEREWNKYNIAVQNEADKIARLVIYPFCKERGWKFSAGNGTWCLWSPEDYKYGGYQETDFPEDVGFQLIIHTLQISIPGMPGNDLGSIMLPYKGEDNG